MAQREKTVVVRILRRMYVRNETAAVGDIVRLREADANRLAATERVELVSKPTTKKVETDEVSAAERRAASGKGDADEADEPKASRRKRGGKEAATEEEPSENATED